MEFKKIYVEITNACNLNCKFCIGNSRAKKYMEFEDFKIILNKLQGYTKYLYFHLMGEPLIHPLINEFIDEAALSYFVNITTNGYFIDKIKDNKNIRQINISLHDYNENSNKTLDEYLTNVLNSTDELSKNDTIITFRMWTRSKHKDAIIKKLNEHFNTRIDGEYSTKLKDHVYYEVEHEFIWPNLNNNYYNENGSCYGTRSHIGVLVSGDIVPCCLDNNGTINLGNIYKNELSDIINGQKFKNMKKGFLENKKLEELCKHCNFYDLRKEYKDSNKDKTI